MRLIKMIGIGLCLAATDAKAQGTKTAVRTLTLTECVQLVVEHNLQIKIEKFSPEIAKLTLAMAYAGYDPGFGFSWNHRNVESPGGFDERFGGFSSSTREDNIFTPRLQGLLPSGMTYTMTANSTDYYQAQIFGGFAGARNESADGSFGFSLSQPLLRNLWIDSTRLTIMVRKNALKGSEESFRFQIMNVVNQVELAYYELIKSIENVKVQEQALQLAERQLADDRKRVEVGSLAPLEEKLSESEVANRRAELLASRRTLATTQNLLKSLLSDNYSLWQDVDIQAADKLSAVPQVFNVQDSWHRGLAAHPEVKLSRLELERLGYELRFTKNQLYPQLDLTGGYTFIGTARDGYGEVYRGLSSEGHMWSVGATFNLPIGNRAARNNYQISKAEQQQSQLRVSKREQDLMIAIDDAIQRAQSSFDRVDATKSAMNYAEAALAAEEKKLENGKSTSYLVLEYQSRLTSARVAALQALADYNRDLAILALREGATLERNKVQIDVR